MAKVYTALDKKTIKFLVTGKNTCFGCKHLDKYRDCKLPEHPVQSESKFVDGRSANVFPISLNCDKVEKDDDTFNRFIELFGVKPKEASQEEEESDIEEPFDPDGINEEI